jgi:SAM-dependent methyltransferase
MSGSTRLSPRELRKNRRTRRHPRPTQFDYLHLRYLVRDLHTVLGRLSDGIDVLDIFCGSRAYDDLLPAGARCTGLDIDDSYGTADVVSKEVLPFADEAFDLVMCIDGFHYVPEPARGLAEIERVLRPGGMVLIAVPLVWQYNRTILEHRYTGPELAALLSEWDDVDVTENGGYAVTWTTLTGRMFDMLQRAVGHSPIGWLARPFFAAAFVFTNGVGVVLDRLERRYFRSDLTLPMNLLVTARRPAGR